MPICLPLLLEAPMTERAANARDQVRAAVARRVPDLLNLLSFAHDGARSNRMLDEWFKRFDGEPVLAKAREIARRRRDEDFAQTFGAATPVIDALSDVLPDLNLAERGVNRAPAAQTNVFEFLEALITEKEQVVRQRERPPADLATAVDQALIVFNAAGPSASRATAVLRVIDQFHELHARVEAARAGFATTRTADGRPLAEDERALLDSLVNLLTVGHEADIPGVRVLRHRLGQSVRAVQSASDAFDDGVTTMKVALPGLTELVRLAKAAAPR